MTNLERAVRLYIYRFIIDRERAPSVDEVAGAFAVSVDDARQTLHRLERPHQLVLRPGTDEIRMAIPLSAVPSAHRVWIDERRHYANCAWDALGVAAMLHSDAKIEAPGGSTGDTIRYAVRAGKLDTADDLSVNFPLPLRRWNDNIVDT